MLNLQTAQQLEAEKDRRIAHLRYFHEHIMKNLKLSSDKFADQLNSKILEIETEKKSQIEELTLSKDELVAKLRQQVEDLKHALEQAHLNNSGQMLVLEQQAAKKVAHLR